MATTKRMTSLKRHGVVAIYLLILIVLFNCSLITTPSGAGERDHHADEGKARCAARDTLAQPLLTLPRQKVFLPWESFMWGPGLETHGYEDGDETQSGAGNTTTTTPTQTALFAHDVIPRSTSKRAVCEFIRMPHKLSLHFPHAMQQLYSCWSWFAAHPDKPEKTLVYPKHHKGFPTSMSPVATLEGEYEESRITFLFGMIKALRDVFNVTFVSDDIAFGEMYYSQDRVITRYVHDSSFMRNNSAYAMNHPTHAHALSSGVVSYYGLAKKSRAGCSTSPLVHKASSPANRSLSTQTMEGETVIPKIAILNRNPRKSKRGLLNAENIARLIKTSILNEQARVPIVYFENMDFLHQVDFFASVDILISPHGAQLTGLGFMPPCGGVLEIFPKGIFFPNFYPSLAVATGLEYRGLYVSDGDMQAETEYWLETTARWNQARGKNICIDLGPVLSSIQDLVDKWHQCCQEQQQ